MSRDSTAISMRFSNYEVFARPDGSPEELGHGGFGRTYLARHQFLGNIVALKVLNEKLAGDDDARRRFLREAREHFTMDHPGIARLTDFGETGGVFYYTLEYCPDGNLKQYVENRGRLEPQEAFEYIRQTAAALEHAHARGVIHRDIKPANLMLVRRPDGTLVVKIIDFGLVKRLVKTRPEETLDHSAAGPVWSATFASPEQMEEHELDERTDIFSLGMTAWYFLAGGGPVDGSLLAVARERLSTESYAPRLPATLSGPLRDLLARMVEKDRVRRPRDCAAVLRELEAALASINGSIESCGVKEKESPSIPVNCPEEEIPALADIYDLEPGGVNFAGEFYTGRECGRRDGLAVRLTLLQGRPLETLEAAGRALERWRAAPVGGVAPPAGVRQFVEGPVLVEQLLHGIPLPAALRRWGPVPLPAAIPMLMHAAGVIDALAGLALVPAPWEEAVLAPGPPAGTCPDWADARAWTYACWVPPLLSRSAGHTAALEALPALQDYARLLYVTLGGRQPDHRAFYSKSVYVPIPRLNGKGNERLAACLSGESCPDSATALLADLLEDEGLRLPQAGFPADPPLFEEGKDFSMRGGPRVSQTLEEPVSANASNSLKLRAPRRLRRRVFLSAGGAAFIAGAGALIFSLTRPDTSRMPDTASPAIAPHSPVDQPTAVLEDKNHPAIVKEIQEPPPPAPAAGNATGVNPELVANAAPAGSAPPASVPAPVDTKPETSPGKETSPPEKDKTAILSATPTMLYIGDSLSVGNFGDELQKVFLKGLGASRLVMVASGGATVTNWMAAYPVYVTRSGYRETRTGVGILDPKPGSKYTTPKIETMLAGFKPEILTIQLGTYHFDAIQQGGDKVIPEQKKLFESFADAIVKSGTSLKLVIWITPPDSLSFQDETETAVWNIITEVCRSHNFHVVDSRKYTHYIKGKSGSDGVLYRGEHCVPWAAGVLAGINAIVARSGWKR